MENALRIIHRAFSQLKSLNIMLVPCDSRFSSFFLKRLILVSHMQFSAQQLRAKAQPVQLRENALRIMPKAFSLANINAQSPQA